MNENDDNCQLFLGNIFGGGNQTDYEPTDNATSFISPEIKIFNGTVGGGFNFDHSTEANPIINTDVTTEIYEGNVFGGGNNGKVTSNPKVFVGDNAVNNTHDVKILGNVYGGGNKAEVEGNTDVVLQVQKGKTEVEGDVFGGGKVGKVTGNTSVTLQPTSSK